MKFLFPFWQGSTRPFLFLLLLLAVYSCWPGTSLLHAAQAQIEHPAALVPRLTQAQAIQAASEFCTKIGAPVDSEVTAVFPVPPTNDHEQHWQARWQVTFKGQAEVEVVDASGSIARYESLIIKRQRRVHAGQPAGKPIPREQAQRQAIAVVAASGDQKELTQLDESTLLQLSEPPTVDSQTWQVRFRRTFHEVPYRDQGAGVMLQPETGELWLFSKNFSTSTPTDFSMNGNMDAYFNVAKGQVATLAGTKAEFVNGTKEIIQPNNFWEVMPENKMPVTTLPEARVTETYRFRVAEKDRWGRPAERFYEVSVDLYTSKVIAGSMSGLALTQAPPTLAEVKQAFRDADEIRVYGEDRSVAKPFVVLSATSHPDIWKELRAKTYFLSPRSETALFAKGKIEFIRNGITHRIGYDLNDGIVLFSGLHWAIVSDTARKWLLEQSLGIKTTRP